MNRSLLFRAPLLILLLAALGAAAKNAASQQQGNLRGSSGSKVAVAATESQEGEKRFQAQCGRCHMPPEDLSPREARAVVRQMRVRANLTAEDERLILKYLAP